MQGWCVARGQRSARARAQSTMLDHYARHETWNVDHWVVALRNASHGACAWRELLLGKSDQDVVCVWCRVRRCTCGRSPGTVSTRLVALRTHTALDIGSQGLTATVCVSMYTGLSQTFLVEVNLSSAPFGPRWERCAPQCSEA